MLLLFLSTRISTSRSHTARVIVSSPCSLKFFSFVFPIAMQHHHLMILLSRMLVPLRKTQTIKAFRGKSFKEDGGEG